MFDEEGKFRERILITKVLVAAPGGWVQNGQLDMWWGFGFFFFLLRNGEGRRRETDLSL